MAEPNYSSYVKDGRVDKMWSLPLLGYRPERYGRDSTGLSIAGQFSAASPSSNLYMIPTEIPVGTRSDMRSDRNLLYDYLQIRGVCWFPVTENDYDGDMLQSVDVIVVYDQFPGKDAGQSANIKPAISDIYKPRFGDPAYVMSRAFQDMANSERFIEIDRKSLRLYSRRYYEDGENPPVHWRFCELEGRLLDYYVDLRPYRTQFAAQAQSGPSSSCVANGNIYLIFLGEDNIRDSNSKPRYSVSYDLFYYMESDVDKYLKKF